jgi:hypothetical protein
MPLSAPEEDYISVHIRVAGDFTTALSKACGCEFVKKGKGDDAGGKVVGTAANPPMNRVLPRVMVDGPFGSASEDFLNYETILLVGGGIGVTPFASILKTIWYRMNNLSNAKSTRLSKVYFTWVIRDFGTAEWFHSLLHAIEEQDTQNRIEINIYLTAKIKEDDMNNIIVSDVGAEKDAITSLRAPTHFGRPNWDRVFGSIVEKHPETDVGVMFCGPPVLSKQLHEKSNQYSNPKGTRFFYGKGTSASTPRLRPHLLTPHRRELLSCPSASFVAHLRCRSFIHLRIHGSCNLGSIFVGECRSFSNRTGSVLRLLVRMSGVVTYWILLDLVRTKICRGLQLGTCFIDSLQIVRLSAILDDSLQGPEGLSQLDLGMVSAVPSLRLLLPCVVSAGSVVPLSSGQELL